MQNSAYQWLNNNVTTPFNFTAYKKQPTHIIINIGTNDNSYGINGTAFETVRLFLLRRVLVANLAHLGL